MIGQLVVGSELVKSETSGAAGRGRRFGFMANKESEECVETGELPFANPMCVFVKNRILRLSRIVVCEDVRRAGVSAEMLGRFAG